MGMLGAILVATLASVTTTAVPTDATPPPVATASASALKPIDPAALQKLLDQTARQLMVPGALLLLRTPQGDVTAAYGTTELGTASPPTAETQFRIASNTKTMTAALILLLAQDGKLRLADPVSKYVPNVPNGDHITIAELLEMRSGLYNYTDAPELAASMDRDLTTIRSPDEILAIAFKRPANAAPGAAYEYNNTNYMLLGLIAEQVAGTPLAQLMQDRLFAPLGMRHTLLPGSSDNSLPAPFAHGYGYGSTAMVLSDAASYPPELLPRARAGTIAPTDYTGLNHSFAAGAGGVISTADDLAIWIRALVGGGVLDAAWQRRWLDSLQPQDPKQPDGQQYGYGICDLRWGPNTLYFHGGETPGYNSKIAYDPANQMTLVVWTNMALSPDEQQPANTLMVKVLDQIYRVSPLSPDH
jgi:D-alanyl-D-alanine carboxypeptidase